ncbi:phage portal protein [Ornithinibacillus sp. JPR2-1]|uniref:phage portal protein n=1 Tax=Ornithinibacillus sp. JPR2-1 TaxID=2094019 RepID=UPI0031DF447B
MTLFQIGQYYPHPDHAERIQRYRDNKKLFKGFHYDVFQKKRNHLSKDQKNLLYITANLPALICKKSADFLFGEPASFDAGVQENSNEQKALERFGSQNNMNITNYESALGNAFRGDAFYKIRWGQRWNGMIDKKLDPFRVFIEAQNPEYVFPETLPGDAKNIFIYHIAFPVEVPNTNKQEFILKVESHYPGKIVNREYRMNPTKLDTEGNILQYRIYAEVIDSFKETETHVPFSLVVHVPNFAIDDSWEGIDDLSEHHSIFDEINMRLSLIAEILDKHSDPAMAVPLGSLGEDEHGNPIFHTARDKIFEYEKGDAEPKYITWNGQLEAAFKELDKLLDYLLMAAEIPPVVLGKDNSGTSGSSGSGIKQRMNSLLLKIKRKRQYFEVGLKQVLIIAQMLEHAKADKVDYKVVENPRVLFNERLADDEMEKATVAQIRSGGKPTKSLKSILMEDYKLTEEQAEKEIQRIRDEEKADGFVDSEVFNREVIVDA